MGNGSPFNIGESFKAGWNFFKDHAMFFILYQIILFALVGLFSMGQGWFWTTWHIVGWILLVLVKMGLYSSSLLVVNGREPGFDQLYANWRLFLSWVIASFLFAFMVGIGFVLFIIPGLYLLTRYGFFPFFIIDKDLGPIDALKSAAQLTKGIRWHTFLLFLACIGLNILGVICFGIGILITVPVTLLALTLVYRKLTAETQPIISVENH